MSKAKIFTIRLDPDIYAQLLRLAAAKGLKPTELAREMLVTGMEAGVLESQKSHLAAMVRMAVGDMLSPVEKRLAAISAKAAIASGSANFLSMILLSRHFGVDEETVMEYYTEAKKQGYEFVRDTKADLKGSAEE